VDAPRSAAFADVFLMTSSCALVEAVLRATADVEAVTLAALIATG
jgi:hypothetical protein